MSVQNPTIPTATQAKGIDAVVLDLQTHLDTDLVWLTNGMGRSYRLTKVEVNKAAFFLPEVYLGTDQFKYFAATPDNDKKGQSIIVVGNETYVNQQSGFFGVLEYPLSIIFSVNMSLIDSTLLETDYFEEHQIEDVRQSLIRNLLGKAYKLTVDEVVREFDDVYTEFDVTQDRGIAHAPMSYFRFNCTVLVREDCLGTSLDRCAAILQNLSADDKNECILPTYDFSSLVVQGNVTAGQQTDLTDWLCTVAPPVNTTSTLFDGVNEEITSPYSASHELDRLDSFSIDCWVKRDAVSGGGTIVAKYDALGFKRGYYLQSFFSTGQVRFIFVSQELGGNWINIVSVPGVALNVWTHVAVTYTGSGLASGFLLYINGVSVAYTTAADALTGTTVTPGNMLKIGVAENISFWKGTLFNAHVWKSLILTPAEVVTMATTPVPANPVQSGSLVYSNRLGGNSIFGSTVRIYPDDTGITTGFQSVNMEAADVVVDTPP